MINIKKYNLNESMEDLEFTIDEALLDELVELVGSEEEVEQAAEEAHNQLLAALEAGEADFEEGDVPEALTIAALIVTLVDLGKLDAPAANDLLKKYLA
jgi:proline dehydrogenase